MAQDRDDDAKDSRLISAGRRGIMQGAGLGAALSLLGGVTGGGGLISTA